MKNERDIFNILEGHEEAPSAQAWNKLEKRLGPDRERKAIYWRVAAAIALLLVGSGAYFWGFQRPGTTEGTVAIETRKPSPSMIEDKKVTEKPSQTPLIARSEATKQPGPDQGFENNIASVEPSVPTSEHIQARKVTKGLPRMKRQTSVPEKGIANGGTASVAKVEKVTKDNKVTEVENAPETQIAQAPQNGRTIPEELKTLQTETTPNQVAQVQSPKKEEAVSQSLVYTMEIKSSQNMEEEEEDEEADNAPRPLLYRLVKSANDVASGKVRGKDLVNKGSNAVNSFFHRDRNNAPSDKDNN